VTGVDALLVFVLPDDAVHEVVVLVSKGGGGRGGGRGHHVTAKCPAHHRVGEAGSCIAGYNLNTVPFINTIRFQNFFIQIKCLRFASSYNGTGLWIRHKALL